jgi:hypothetical protein
MVTDTEGAAAEPTEPASAGIALLAEVGDDGVSAGADEAGSVGMTAPHLMQNLVICCGSNPQVTHFRESMICLSN